MKRLVLILLFLAAPSYAVTLQEFRALAVELAPKVNLFADTWAADPSAELFGGTTRDYLYWLKGQLAKGVTPAELRALPVIDVRDFVIGESDVDIVGRVALDPQRYGVRKIDAINADRFNPATILGQNEIKQGYIPMEKIRLGKNGFVRWDGFGDGVREIHEGKPTLVAPDPKEFAATHYASRNLNHEILLALRFVRILAMNYFREHGSAYPDRAALLLIDPASLAAVRAIVDKSLESPELAECLKQPQFVMWLNQTVQKAFRSYTNPTAAHMLFVELGLDKLVAQNAGKIEPINQYLFAKHRDPAAIAANFARFGTTPENLYSKVSSEFPDGTLYHGTKDDPSFRNILLQGILPSTGGSAGGGLYGVEQGNIGFAEGWGAGRDFVVSFKVRPGARIVDTTTGEGARLFRAFGGTEDAFAEAFGVDIIRYPYHTRAYVVKNSAALEKPQGLTRQVMTFSRYLEIAGQATTAEKTLEFLAQMELNAFTTAEQRGALEHVPYLKGHPLKEELFSINRELLSQPIKRKLAEILFHAQDLMKGGRSARRRVKRGLDSLERLLSAEQATGQNYDQTALDVLGRSLARSLDGRGVAEMGRIVSARESRYYSTLGWNLRRAVGLAKMLMPGGLAMGFMWTFPPCFTSPAVASTSRWARC